MIKDYLKENQPLFYRIIENEFNLKKIPHAFLLVGNNTDQPLQFLTMSLICNETLACEQCIDCQKVLNHQYADIIEIDGEEESIKKKHIENIQETFKKSSLEGKAKVYILKNVEKTTKEAMNALLKILEEPTEGIYAIFTTKNINRILPTIISRCQVIELKPDNKEVLKEKLIAKGYEEEKASVLSYIIKDEDDLENLNQDDFDDIMLQAINFVEDLFLYRENLIINTQIHMLKDHKEKENIKLFINFIILALKDMFHVKQNEKAVFCNHVKFFNSLTYDNNDIIKKIELNKRKTGFTVNETGQVSNEDLFPSIISKFRGHTLLVDFWATWCGPCRTANKAITPMKEELKDKDIIYLYITGETSPKGTWENMITDIHGEHFRVTNEQWSFLMSSFNIRGVPTYFVVDPEGNITFKQTGFPGVDTMKKELMKALNK